MLQFDRLENSINMQLAAREETFTFEGLKFKASDLPSKAHKVKTTFDKDRKVAESAFDSRVMGDKTIRKTMDVVLKLVKTRMERDGYNITIYGSNRKEAVSVRVRYPNDPNSTVDVWTRKVNYAINEQIKSVVSALKSVVRTKEGRLEDKPDAPKRKDAPKRSTKSADSMLRDYQKSDRLPPINEDTVRKLLDRLNNAKG